MLTHNLRHNDNNLSYYKRKCINTAILRDLVSILNIHILSKKYFSKVI